MSLSSPFIDRPAGTTLLTVAITLAGILGYETRPLVSVDFKDDPRSGIVDAPSTMVTDKTQVKILAWYDNEWGYANRLVELACTVAAGLPPDRLSAGPSTTADG